MRSSSFRLSSRSSLTRVLSLSISSIPVSPVRRRKSTSSVGIYGLVMMKVSIPQILYIGWYERQISQIVTSDGYWMEIYTSFFCGISLCKDTKACRYMQIIKIFLLIINRLFTFQGTTNESTSCVLLHQIKWIIGHPCSLFHQQMFRMNPETTDTDIFSDKHLSIFREFKNINPSV